MTALFVTATGTDIGKTFVTAGLVHELRRRGRQVRAVKPVVSGFDPADWAASDPGVLLRALGRALTAAELDAVSPWRFRAPLAPDLAARREGRVLNFAALVDFSHRAVAAAPDALLIEGVGGVMVPLDERRTVLDWMAALRLPALLVAGSYLGTVSHTLTALDALARHGLTVTAMVVAETQGATVPLADIIETISRFAGGVEVLGLPRLASVETGHATFMRLADMAFPPRQIRRDGL